MKQNSAIAALAITIFASALIGWGLLRNEAIEIEQSQCIDKALSPSSSVSPATARQSSTPVTNRIAG